MAQKKYDPKKLWRPFFLTISLVIVLFLVGIYFGFIYRINNLISDQFLVTARAHFRNIVITRRWNANYGGVFIKKTPGIISNPYLKNPDIETKDGVVYTMKNPALMTREISEYAAIAGDFKFHITSLKPLNPNNAPDDFERNALSMFEMGEKENYTTQKSKGRTVFRYMAPLFVEEGCMQCHAEQGYKIGDVRGGISVEFDVTDVTDGMIANNRIIIILCIITIILLITIIYFVVIRLVPRLNNAYQVIEKMSITDELTQISNRRYFHEKLKEEISRSKRYERDLTLIILDLDNFKNINDTHGHPGGDEILVQVAQVLNTNSRTSDTLTRFGGEEFAIILPETDLSSGKIFAEKARRSLDNHDFHLEELTNIRVTASFGVASLAAGVPATVHDETVLIKWADDALYRAKSKGRNTVEAHE